MTLLPYLEAIESFFILYRVTGDVKYREWAWTIFLAMERHSRVPNGYASLKDVRSSAPEMEDQLETFFFAETLKYLYLIFSPSDHYSLEEYVFNTEAHPFKVWKK